MSDNNLPNSVETSSSKTIDPIDSLVEICLVDKTLQEAVLKRLLENDSVKTNLVKMLKIAISNSKTSYYTQEAALAIKGLVDEMIVDKIDRQFNYSDYPTYSPSTTKQKLYMGIKYLVEHLDTEDGKYHKWREDTEIQEVKEGGVPIGILIRQAVPLHERRLPKFIARKVIDGTVSGEASKPYVKGNNTANLWKTVIIEFMESDKVDIDIREVVLNQEDKDWIKNLFLDPGIFVVKVTSVRILIKKIPEYPLERVSIE